MTRKSLHTLRIFIAVGYYLLIALPLVVSADQVTLQWDGNNPEPDGYNLYQRVEGGSYDYNQAVNSELITGSTYTVGNLQAGIRYYFVVRAVLGSDSSGDSNEVEYLAQVEVLDTDGDGYDDPFDAFPNDAAEWLDSDGDGIGNNADLDDDQDGMPDAYENQYGLDPLKDDAQGDLDGDGVDNISEYRSGTDPANDADNHPPDQPVLIAPADGTMDVSLVPTLVCGAFHDPDGDGHARTHYQIALDPDWDHLNTTDLVFDGVFETRLTRLPLVDLVLDPETTFYWRLKFIDARNASSAWSQTYEFTTSDNLTAGYYDDDGNGILNHQEVSYWDDALGLEASEDPVVIGTDDDLNPQLGLVLSTGADVVAVRSISADAVDTLNAPEALTGLISFKLRMLEGAATANLTLYLSQPAPPNALWYKYSLDNGWAPYDHVVFSADRRSVNILLVDGGPGDDDGVQNGLIVDPSGLGYSPSGLDSSLGYQSQTSDVASSSDWDGSACFIAQAMGADASEDDMNPVRCLYAALMLAMAFISAVRFRP